MRIRLSDLAPGVNYALQLRSNTGGAVSDWSRVFNIVTSSDAVAPNTPTGVAGSMSGSSFQLTWNAVTTSADGSPAYDLDRYEVKVESTGTGTTGIYIVSDTKFLFDFTMNQQLFGTARANVKMSVRAVDKVGNTSAYSSVIDQTNPAPANPANFTATPAIDSIILKWDAVADTDVAFYKVYVGTVSGTQTTPVWQGSSTGATVASTAYLSDRWYRVVAVDVFGTESVTGTVAGPVRPNSALTVDSSPPAVPTGLAAVLTTAADTTTSAAVSWTAVADPDNDLAGYRIGYRPVGASDWQYTDVDYTNTSTRIDRLTPYVNYEFRIRSYDFSFNFSAWSSTVTTSTAATDTAPSQPSAPTVSVNTMQIQVTHDGLKQAGGALEPDVDKFYVYTSTTTGFTPGATNKIGEIDNGPTKVGTFYLPISTTDVTWYVKVIAVDRGGNLSPASNQATSTPGLLSGVNITDASIGSAKIVSLVADKITAGSGLINDIIVKSKLTLGDASTVGAIESYGYVAGTTGFRFDKNLLEINQGSIAAAALKLQDSANIIPPQWADFEFTPTFYTGKMTSASPMTKVLQTTGGRFGNQWLDCTNPTAAAADTYLGDSSTDYNINVEAGEQYIISAWVKGGTINSNFQMRFRYDDGTLGGFVGVTTITAGSAWQRVSGVTAAVPAGRTKAVVDLQCGTATIGAGWGVDGVQVEKKVSAATTASAWKPPSYTQIDGGILRTGEMRSTTNIVVGGSTQPSWSLNTQGNLQIGDALIRGKLIVGTGAEVAPNRAPNNGDFETNVTGYSVYQLGATGTAIARTTTVGEVITGTGSAKVTAAAGSKTSLGLSFNPPTVYQPGTKIKVEADVRVNSTGGSIYVSSWNSSIAQIDILEQVIAPVVNEVYHVTYEYTVPDGQDVAAIVIFQGNTHTSTYFIADNITLTTSLDQAISYVQSAGFVSGEGGSGWNIDGSGNVEFNTGIFRGSLGAGIVTADSLAATMTISNVFRTAETGRRVEFSQDGITLFRSDNTPMVSLPTDEALTASIDGDFLAQSLTITDSMAIRGDINELSKGSTLTIQSGTTAPNSPPQISVDWNTLNLPAQADFDVWRYGITLQGGWYRIPVQIYGFGVVVESVHTTTGARQYGSLNTGGSTGMWTGYGGITSIGNNVYLLGQNKAGAWRIMGFTFGTSVSGTPTKFLDVAYPQASDHYKPAIGNDGTNLVIASCYTGSGLMFARTFNATTGAQIGGTLVSDIVLRADLASINKGTFDGAYGATTYVVTSRNHTTAYVFNSSLQRLSKWDFPLVAKPAGQAYTSAGKFVTYDAIGHRITEHTDIVWDNTVSGNGSWYAVNTWYNTDATNGNKETTMGPQKAFTMKQRGRLTVTSPPIPIRPLPNTVDDATAAGVYMARGSTIPVRTKLERQPYLADGVRSAVYSTAAGITLPAAGVDASQPPPSASNFPNTSPATLKSENSRFVVSGDGSGNWGAWQVDSAGTSSIIANAFVTANMYFGDLASTSAIGTRYRKLATSGTNNYEGRTYLYDGTTVAGIANVLLENNSEVVRTQLAPTGALTVSTSARGNNAVPVAAGYTSFSPRMGFFEGTVTTLSTGLSTFNHGLGFTPAHVVVCQTANSGSAGVVVAFISATSTQMTVKCWLATTGAVVNAGNVAIAAYCLE